MKLGLWGVLVGLSSVGLAACLADIPELTGAGGSTGVGGGATTAVTAASTATGFCDELGAAVDFCADFDGPGGVAEGWDFNGDDDDQDDDIHIELDESEISPPSSAHIWVDDDADACTYAQLKKQVVEPESDPAFNFNFEFQSQITGIVAELEWIRGTAACQVLVYVNEPNITLSLRDEAMVVPSTEVRVPIPADPFGDWHDFEIHFDRAARTFAFRYDDMDAPPSSQAAEEWLAACADSDPEPGGVMSVNIGSYCVVAGNDMANDNHYDNVTFDFE